MSEKTKLLNEFVHLWNYGLYNYTIVEEMMDKFKEFIPASNEEDWMLMDSDEAPYCYYAIAYFDGYKDAIKSILDERKKILKELKEFFKEQRDYNQKMYKTEKEDKDIYFGRFDAYNFLCNYLNEILKGK